MLDRMDIFIEVPRIEYEKMADDRLGEKSEAIQARVEAARAIQQKRFEGTPLTANSDMTPIEIREYCKTDADAQNLLQAAVNQLSLSARSYHHILKLARTIADLDVADTVGSTHVAEALQYRSRKMF